MGASKQVILVTGGSSGLGQAFAAGLHARNHLVYGTSRNPEKVGDVPYPLLQMDLTDEDSIKIAVSEILGQHGKIDVLINCAGVGFNGPVEDTSIEEMRAVFNSNVWGLLRCTQACLPSMRAQKRGLIINVSSIAGRVALPFRGVYSASKFAVEAFSESLSMEVKRFGIDVVILEPGDFATAINDNRKIAAAMEDGSSVYKQQFIHVNNRVIEEVKRGRKPADAVRHVINLVEGTGIRPLRKPIAPFLQRMAVHLHNVLPGRWFERLVMNLYKL